MSVAWVRAEAQPPARVTRDRDKIWVDGILVAKGGSYYSEQKRGRIPDEFWERVRWCVETERRMTDGGLEPPLGPGVDFFTEDLLDSWLLPYDVRAEIAYSAQEEARRVILDEIDAYCAKLRPALDAIAAAA